MQNTVPPIARHIWASRAPRVLPPTVSRPGGDIHRVGQNMVDKESVISPSHGDPPQGDNQLVSARQAPRLAAVPLKPGPEVVATSLHRHSLHAMVGVRTPTAPVDLPIEGTGGPNHNLNEKHLHKLDGSASVREGVTCTNTRAHTHRHSHRHAKVSDPG